MKNIKRFLGKAGNAFSGIKPSKTLLAFAALAIISLASVAKATLFNLEITGKTLSSAQGNVPASSAVDIKLTGIDTNLANTDIVMGTSTATYQTTSGEVTATTGEFSMYSGINTLSDGSVKAGFAIDRATQSSDYVFIQAKMPAGFTFSDAASYAAFFEAINTNGVYNKNGNLCQIPAIGQSFESFSVYPETLTMAIPEPTSLLVLATGAAMLRRRKGNPSGPSASLA